MSLSFLTLLNWHFATLELIYVIQIQELLYHFRSFRNESGKDLVSVIPSAAAGLVQCRHPNWATQRRILKKKKKKLCDFSQPCWLLKFTEDDAFELRFCKVLWVWDSGASWETDSEGRGGKKQPVAHCMSPVICRTVWVYLPQGWFNCF